MNMLPAGQNLSKHHLIYGYYSTSTCFLQGAGYGGCSDQEDEVPYYIGGLLPFLPMAAEDDLSRTETSTHGSGSSSKNNNNINDHDQDRDIDQGWLQLSIGSGGSGTHNHNYIIKDDEDERSSRRLRGGLIELDLLPPGNSSSSNLHVRPPPAAPRPPPQTTTLTTPNHPYYNYYNTATSSMFFQQNQHPGCTNIISGFPQQHQQHHHQQQDIMNSSSWGFGATWPRNALITSTPSSSSPSTAGFPPPFFIPRRPFQIHAGGVSGSSAGIDFRVIDPPPRRLHSGIWFMLQAAQNQAKEPFLPQISKNFLRIKDGRITVRLVQKYLVNKLKLESESEIEIRCRGQQVEPLLTLEHIRDNIWRRSANLTLLPNSSTLDHIMVLDYARTP